MKNFEIIDSKDRISYLEAEKAYKNANYLMINVDYVNGVMCGNVYAVSRDSSTQDKLLETEDVMINKGIQTLIGGEYSNSVFDTVELVSMKRVNNG